MASQFPLHLIATLCAVALLPGVAAAAESRVAVKPRHGEMVLLRDVNARHAYRPVPPSVALIVDPTPTRELSQILGTGELSDDDFAAISSGHSLGPTRPANTVERTVGGALGASLGTADHGGAVAGSGLGASLSTPLGVVGTTTRGIGGHVTGALSQFPLGQMPTGPDGP